MGDLVSLKPDVELGYIDKDEKVEVPDTGTEETPADSSPEKTPEPETTQEEKVDELAILKDQVAKLSQENNHVKDSMQRRIDELTWQIKNQKEQVDKNKERTWDDITSAEEVTNYIKHYSELGDGNMVAFLTNKLTDIKISERFDSTSKTAQSNSVRVQSWTAITEEFPDLKNPNSQHYKETEAMVKSDPRFDDIKNFPEGHAVAAQLAAVKILKEQLKSQGMKSKDAEVMAKKAIVQNALDGSTAKSGNVGTSKDLGSLMDKAMDSKNPWGTEWKDVLRKVNSARK